MNYEVDEAVPEHWQFIIDSFITQVEYYMQYNKMPEVWDIGFNVKRGLLDITYCGGDKNTDAMAALAREISSTICSECFSLAERRIFGHPICGECD